MTTFEQIRKAAQYLYDSRTNYELASEVGYMVDCGRVNADDTCCVEKSRPMEDYDAVALASLEQACAYAEKHQVDAVAWFVKHGVKF